MTIKAICFDLDGTLLDTIEDLAAAINAVLEQQQFPLRSPEECQTYVGNGLNMLIERALPENARTPDMVMACVNAFHNEYETRLNVHSRLYDGMAEVLDELTRQGIRLSILSNKPHRYTKLCVQHYFSNWPFDPVYGQMDGVPSKPDPTLALQIAKEQGLEPSNFLFVGDSGVDMTVGIAAGMQVIGVSWGYRPVADLEKAKPLAVINQPKELLSFC